MNIALIAHDAKKKLMQNFCIAYRGILSKNELYATGTTGRLIEEVTNLNVHKYLAGHLGGEQQIGAQIEHNEIDLVIFLRDPLAPKAALSISDLKVNCGKAFHTFLIDNCQLTINPTDNGQSRKAFIVLSLIANCPLLIVNYLLKSLGVGTPGSGLRFWSSFMTS